VISVTEMTAIAVDVYVPARVAHSLDSKADRLIRLAQPLWQLIINTVTTIVTFLLVALLQNSQRRGEKAMHEKLDALADGLADLMEKFAHDDPDLRQDMEELRRCVGIEDDESRTDDLVIARSLDSAEREAS
jgi:low affinity Fe/Cu permease